MKRHPYWFRRLHRDVRAVGGAGAMGIGFIMTMIVLPVGMVDDIAHGYPARVVVMSYVMHIILYFFGYYMLVIGAHLLGRVERYKTWVSWHLTVRAAQENAKLTAQRLGYEEHIRSQIIRARREIEQERNRDGEGWK